MKKSDINPPPQYFNRYKASAKIRTGNPVDDAEDYTIDVWAGVIPKNFFVKSIFAKPQIVFRCLFLRCKDAELSVRRRRGC